MSTVQLVVLGKAAVGKSSVTIYYISNVFESYYDPTIEDSYRKSEQIDGRAVILDILDTAGEQEYSSMRSQYYRDGEGFMLIYSITERGGFEGDMQSIYKDIVRTKEGSPFSVLLFGNKSDLLDDRQVSIQEAQELADSWGMPFMEGSAKTGSNVTAAFQSLARACLEKRPKQAEPGKGKCALL
jgi:small GTP-binding protein